MLATLDFARIASGVCDAPVAPDCAPGFEQQQRLAEMSFDVGLEARRPPRSALLTPPPPSSGRPPNPLALAVAHSACSMHQWQSMCGVFALHHSGAVLACGPCFV